MTANYKPSVLLLTLLMGALPLSCSPARRSSTKLPRSMERIRVGAAWDDPLRCVAAVEAGARMPRSRFRMRLVTFSLGFFPDGALETIKGEGSNVDWVACAITWLDADVVTLQRLKLEARGIEAADRLVEKLTKLTGAEWKITFDACPASRQTHVAILWRTDRAQVSLVASHPELDVSAHTDALHPDCPGGLSPALGAFVTSTVGGLDFHLVTFELDPAEGADGLARRQEAWRAIGRVAAARQNMLADPDLVLAAAFNTVGAKGTEIKTAMTERESLARALAGLELPLTLLEPADTCSEYRFREARETDYMAVSAAMQEAKGLTPRASGLCGALHCQSIDPNAYLVLRQISKHCPIVFDLHDRDED